MTRHRAFVVLLLALPALLATTLARTTMIPAAAPTHPVHPAYTPISHPAAAHAGATRLHLAVTARAASRGSAYDRHGDAGRSPRVSPVPGPTPGRASTAANSTRPRITPHRSGSNDDAQPLAASPSTALTTGADYYHPITAATRTAHGTTATARTRGRARRCARHGHTSHRRAPSATPGGRVAAHPHARIKPVRVRGGAMPARVGAGADPLAPVSLRRTLPSTLPIQTGDAALDAAEATALATLTADQAGAPTHRAAPFYITSWIRDSFAWGMIPDNRGTLATYSTTELAYWLARQQPFGGFVSFQYSGWYDETPIIIAAVLDAYRQTGDLSMVRRALPQLERAWTWMDHSYALALSRHGSSCLIWVDLRPRGAHFAADWADQVARQGYSPQLQGLWLRATRALAALELLAGQQRQAHGYIAAASCIARDINRLLWSVDAPAHVNAAPLPAFGHYRAWPVVPGRAYFEVDGNALLVAADAASATGRDSVLSAIMANRRYLLGDDGAGPARVLYGDYAPSDYAPIHNWIGPGRYQSAYWPTVGGLLAIAAARYDHTTTSLAVLEGLARRDADPVTGFHEWYGGDGTPGGAATYGWGARMYLLALYRAALGVDDSTSLAHPADLTLRASPLEARGQLTRLGRHITVIGHGKGRVRYVRLDGRTLHTAIVPAALLHDGSVLDVYRG